jgi:hypothetical protein
MADENRPYVTFEPGGLITAEGMNSMQEKIRADIGERIEQAVAALTSVPNAEDAAHLEGRDLEELCGECLEEALQQIPKRTGYRKLFKVLETGRQRVIEHGLKACPLVDVFQLEPFEVVCAVDEDKSARHVNLYLYHTMEKRLTDPANSNRRIPIEPTDGPPFKIPWALLLEMLEVPYTESSSLGDLETEFWKALFAEPNDEFDPEQYCHSPWFEHCCREERTVESMKAKGDWDDLWFQMRPRKTINYPFTDESFDNVLPTPAPTQVEVVHFDLDTIGITLLRDALVPNEDPNSDIQVTTQGHLKVLVLLKV